MPFEVLIREVGFGIVLPAVIAVVIVLAARPRSAGIGRLAGAASSVVGWLAAVYALGLFPFVPSMGQAWTWLPLLAVVAGAIGAATPPGPARTISTALLAGLVAGLLVPTWESFAEARNSIRLVFSVGIFALAMTDQVGELDGARLPALALSLASGGAAIILDRSATWLFSQMAAALAAALAGLAIFGCRPEVVSGVLPAFAVLHIGLLATGRFHSHTDVPLSSFILCALAPLGLAIPLPRVRRKSLLRLGLVALVVAIAVALAIRAEPFDYSWMTGKPIPSESQPVP